MVCSCSRRCLSRNSHLRTQSRHDNCVITYLPSYLSFYLCACVTCGSFRAGTGVRVLSVLTGASVSARLTQALVYVGLTQAAGVSRATITGESGHAIPAHAVMTRARHTLVDVQLAVSASKTCRWAFETHIPYLECCQWHSFPIL